MALFGLSSKSPSVRTALFVSMALVPPLNIAFPFRQQGFLLGPVAVATVLSTILYRGEITHKGKSYPGEHPAIIDQPLWDEVQAVLAQNRVERATGARAKHPSLLGGFVFDATGERLTPTYAIKKGTRYRYYVSSSLVREATGNRAGGDRLPAGGLEGMVISRLHNFFSDPPALLHALDKAPNRF